MPPMCCLLITWRIVYSLLKISLKNCRYPENQPVFVIKSRLFAGDQDWGDSTAAPPRFTTLTRFGLGTSTPASSITAISPLGMP